jgi:predicted RNase H-like HicB family nuclease
MEVFREGRQYVSLCPELNVSSFGETQHEAEEALREAVRLFVEQCEEMGTLADVLTEAGFHFVTEPPERWVSREPVKLTTAEA